MSRKIYIGTGTSRRIRQLYVGSGNVARRVKAAYVGVGGSARKFWPILYKWNRYEVNSTVQYTPYVRSDEVIEFGRWTEFGQYSLIYSYDTYVYGGNFLYRLYSGERFPDPDCVDDLPNGTTFYAFEYWVGYNGGSLSYIRADFGLNSSATDGTMVEFIKQSGSYGGTVRRRIHTYSKQTVTSAGSYIDQVTSENRNAYPDNGVSGSYWYVFQGEA